MDINEKTTKWNIDLRKKTNISNKKEPFLVTSNFQQPLLQTLPSSTSLFSTLENIIYPVKSTSIESMSNSTSIPTYAKILELTKGDFKNPNSGEPGIYPGQNNYIDSNGVYYISVYNGNTYLNGFNCNNDGCDMSGVSIYVNGNDCKKEECDISKIDITTESGNTKVNTPNSIIIEDGYNKFDASTINLKGVTFGGKTLVEYLKSQTSNSMLGGNKPLNLPALLPTNSKKSFDIITQSYYTPANPKTNNNDSIINLFDATSTIRSNPFTSNTMNTPVGNSEEGMTDSKTEGIVKLNTDGSNPKQVFKNFISWWKYTLAPYISKNNPIALVNSTLVYFFNKFIQLFGGNYPVIQYFIILFYYYIFIGYLICIFVTYNLFYSFFFKQKVNIPSESENSNENVKMNFFIKMLNAILLKIPPLGFVYGLRNIINQIPDFLIILLKWMKLDSQDSYKLIFILIFVFSFYFILRLSIIFYTAFCNSLRFGNDDSGNTDSFTNNMTIFLVIYIIFTTIYYYNDSSLPPYTLYSPVCVIATIFFLVVKIIVSTSLVWITVFLMCLYIFFVTIIPIQGFTIIDEVNRFFNELNTYTNCENSTNCNEPTFFSKIIKFIIDFIYKNIFQIGLIVIFSFQLINHCYYIENEYVNFKSILIIICLLFIILGIVLIFFTQLQSLFSHVMVFFLNLMYIIIPMIIFIGVFTKKEGSEVSR